VRLYYPAAMQGLADAQLNLGMRLWNIQGGSDLPKTRALVQDWWHKAAAQGLQAANQNLAAIGAWNTQSPISFNQVSLIESTDFARARGWNPPTNGLIPAKLWGSCGRDIQPIWIVAVED
jgi:hypothetical protein